MMLYPKHLGIVSFFTVQVLTYSPNHLVTCLRNVLPYIVPSSSSPPRLFCAKLVQQDYTADDDINTLSNINDDDGIHLLTNSLTHTHLLTHSLTHSGDYSKYITFRSVAIVFVVLTALMIAIVMTVFYKKQRSDTLLSNNV